MRAAFVGTPNSKTCPQSYFQVETEAECQSLAAIADKWYGGSVNLKSSPPGCFWLNVGGGIYLNTHATGAAHRNAQQLCAGAPNARPTAACMGRRKHPKTRTDMLPYQRLAAAHVGRRIDAICRVQRDAAHVQPFRRYGRSLLHGARPVTCSAVPCQMQWCVELRAAFAIGGTNSDGCPQIYSRLKTEEACKSLAAIAGASLGIAGAAMYVVSNKYAYYPAGCFRHTVTGKFYWNKNESGANNSFAQPLCAGAPARPHALLP
jgi:hypothetical protein